MITSFWSFLSHQGFSPHGDSYLWNPHLLWIMGISDGLMSLVSLLTALTLYLLLKKVDLPFRKLFISLWVFFIIMSLVHALDVYTLWQPTYWTSAAMKIAAACVAIITGVQFFQVAPKTIEMADAVKLAETTQVTLERAYQQMSLDEKIFKKRLTRNIVLPLVLVTTLAAIFVAQIFYLTSINRWAAHADEAIAEANKLYKLFVDSETGIRGFVITKKNNFLEPYRKAQVQIPTQITKLRNQLILEPLQADLIQSVEQKYELWSDFATKTIFLVEKGRGSIDYVSLGAGKEVMDAIRGTMDELIQQEQRTLVDRNARTQTAIHVLLIVTLVLSLSAGGYLALFGREQLFTLSKNYKSALDELRLSQEELEKRVEARTIALKASNQELEAFSYSVSHDLRAPLRGIDGFSQAILEEYSNSLDERGKKYLNYVREGVQRMGKLIDDMLTLSRLSRAVVQSEDIDFTAIAKTIAAGLHTREKDRQVHFDIQENMKAHGDPILLEAVIENLLSNSWKFTAKVPQAQIQFGMTSIGNRQVYYVKDNGAGFDMTYSNKLFGAFQRLHSFNEFKGTGVGLASAKRIISRHGGEIWVEAAVNQGATFYFTLNESVEPMREKIKNEGSSSDFIS